jgi:hypothetical protein
LHVFYPCFLPHRSAKSTSSLQKWKCPIPFQCPFTHPSHRICSFPSHSHTTILGAASSCKNRKCVSSCKKPQMHYFSFGVIPYWS